MHPHITEAQREIIEAFNSEPKTGIQKIKDICERHNISPVTEIANFFHEQKHNLNLDSVGDYLSGENKENKEALEAFTAQMDFKDQSFTASLRKFLKAFKLPGEAQKIDRLVDSFSATFCRQNPEVNIASTDSAYILAFQVIMLNTDLHNPSVAKKMDINSFKKNLEGTNYKTDARGKMVKDAQGKEIKGNFDDNFLKGIYAEIKATPFEFNFVKTSPGYEVTSKALQNDATFNQLDSLLQSTTAKPQDIFPGIDPGIITLVDKPKSWLNKLTGYEGTLTFKNAQGAELATMQIYKPGFFAKFLWGEQPRLIIQPVAPLGSVDFAAKLAASFSTPVSSIKGTYDYEKSDLKNAYDAQKKLIPPTQSPGDIIKHFKQELPKEPEQVQKNDAQHGASGS